MSLKMLSQLSSELINLNTKIQNELRLKKDTFVTLAEWDKKNCDLWKAICKYNEHIIINGNGQNHISSIYEEKKTYYNSSNLIETRRHQLTLETLQRQYSFVVKRLEAICNRILPTINEMHLDELNYERNNIKSTYELIQTIGLQRIGLGDNVTNVSSEETKVDQAVNSAFRLIFDAQKNQALKTFTNTFETDIAAFDGKFENWQVFHEKFHNEVHAQPNIPDLEKLKLLKSVLCGEPKELVQNFSLTNENYIAAWNLLNERYNNEMELFSSHIRLLTNLPECSDSMDLCHVRFVMTRSVKALQQLKRPVEKWNDWLVNVVGTKLDKNSRDMWMQKIASEKDFPTWNQLDKFVEDRIKATLFAVSPSTPPQTLQR